MKWGEYISLEKGHYNFCMWIAFFIPLHKKTVTFLIGLFVMYTIIYFIRRKSTLSWVFQPAMFFSALLYTMLFVSAFNSSFPEVAWKELEFKASMFVFPLLALLHPGLSKNELYRIFNAFTTGTLLFALVALSYGIYRVNQYGSLDYLTYSKLGIVFHPTYMAVYQSLALLWILMRGVRQDYFFSIKWIHWIAGGFTVLFISMLASKAGIISAGICIFLAGFAAHRRYIIPRHYILVCLSSLVFLFATSMLLPLTASRFERSAKDIATSPVGENSPAYSSTELRKVTWAASFEVLRENPFGLGAGNVGAKLEELYERDGETYAAEHQLNTHNQFLQIAAELGWPGLLLMILIFLLTFVQSIKSGTFIFPAFILVTGVNCLFESMLEVQAGVVFFFFFLMVFVKTDFKSEGNHWV